MEARIKLFGGAPVGSNADPAAPLAALAHLIARALQQPDTLATEAFRRQFGRLVRMRLAQGGAARAEVLDAIEECLEGAQPLLAETLRELAGVSLQPQVSPAGADWLPLISRMGGEDDAQSVARCLLDGLRDRYGAAVAGELVLEAPGPQVLASLRAISPSQGDLASAGEPLTVRWHDRDRPIGRLTVTGLTSAQRSELEGLAPWLQPTIRRLVERQERGHSELLYARQRRQWQVRAELLDLSQTPQAPEAYLRHVVDKLQRLFEATQVSYWAYAEAEDVLEVRHRSCPDRPAIEVAVSAGVFQEAIDNRQVRTAALPDAEGRWRLLLLAPVFDEAALLGVFQVIMAEACFTPSVEEDLSLVCELVASGLKTVRFYEQLSYHASHDALTGLANRRSFEQLVTREFKLAGRHAAPLSLLMLDVDHFKRYNDAHGHPAGDALLVALARALEAAVRSTDFVARLGGEEFVVVLPHTDAEGALRAAHKIGAAIRGLHAQGAVPHAVTVSMGSASFPADGRLPEALVEAADRALYRAKHAGRDRVCQAGDASA